MQFIGSDEVVENGQLLNALSQFEVILLPLFEEGVVVGPRPEGRQVSVVGRGRVGNTPLAPRVEVAQVVG